MIRTRKFSLKLITAIRKVIVASISIGTSCPHAMRFRFSFDFWVWIRSNNALLVVRSLKVSCDITFAQAPVSTRARLNVLCANCNLKYERVLSDSGITAYKSKISWGNTFSFWVFFLFWVFYISVSFAGFGCIFVMSRFD